MKIKYLSISVMALFLSSCAHSLPYQSSGITTPVSWDAMTMSDTGAQVEQYWWKNFNDPVLDDLIGQAVRGNKNLGIARARVQEAMSNVEYANANQWPDITGVVAPSRGNQGFATGYKPIGLVSAEVQATWEIDIFGRNLPLISQAKEIAQYAEAARQGVLVGLLSELGKDYFDLQDERLQVEITTKNLKLQQRTLGLIKAQQQGAMASDFDVQRAAAQVSSTAAKLPALQSAYQMTLNRIRVLLGQGPEGDRTFKVSDYLQPLDQRIIVAAPATVLANRPDVKAAERNLASSMSNKEYAQKQFFPDISLLSFFGAEGVTKHLPAYPWSVGLTIVQPLVDFGRIKAQINVARAQENEAFLSYQETILEALADMENALTSYKNEVVRNQSLRASVKENRRAEDLAQRQFKSGYIGLLDLLVAQGNLLDAESALADSDIALRKDLVNIYTASGGGWQV